MSESLKLEFESGFFLQSLLGGEMASLAYLEEALSLEKVVSRDGWVLFEGEPDALMQAQNVFSDLEDARRGGALLTQRDFRLAVDMVVKQSNQSVTQMMKVKLLGSRGKKAVVPKSPVQADYILAMQEHDVTFGLGPAGTGKTYLAMAMALALLKDKQVTRVVLTRPAVEAPRPSAIRYVPAECHAMRIIKPP